VGELLHGVFRVLARQLRVPLCERRAPDIRYGAEISVDSKRSRPEIADRHLIVNADDFGLSAGINRGVIEAHELGIVTSTTLMVRWPAAAEAADYGRQHPGLSIGLHIDLCEWTYRDDAWMPRYERVPLDDSTAVEDEVRGQLDLFRALMGREPTHLDSHQHIHRDEPVRSIGMRIARELAIPLRHCTPHIHYCGDFYGQSAAGWPYPEGISVENLLRIFASLPAGITELACHPGYEDGLDSMYASERSIEVETLCDPRISSAIDEMMIVLCSFDAPLHEA